MKSRRGHISYLYHEVKNMKLQSMSLRRIVACVLSLLMIITALPLGVSANGGGGGDTGGGDDMPLTVTAEKGIVVDDELEIVFLSFDGLFIYDLLDLLFCQLNFVCIVPCRLDTF